MENAANEASPEMEQEARRIAQGLYDGTLQAGTIDPALTKLVAKQLSAAVINGFGKSLDQCDYGTPDYNMLSQLERNVYHFAGAKNYQELKSMSLALKDSEGKVRPEREFKREAVKISGEYNGTYLATEYDTAIGSAQMAGKWVDIQQNIETAPLLRYDTANDSKVRKSHRLLNGVIRRADDDFWKTWYPPLGWKCRCGVTQLLQGTPTKLDQIITPDDVPKMFQTNMAEDGLVFPKDHPYYIDCPEHVLRKAELLRDNVFSRLPKDKAAKADIYVASLADPVDIEQNIILSRRMAALGEEVYIQPHSGAKDVKNPEIKLGASTGDYKVDAGKTTIEKFVRNSLDSANKQTCEIPVIVIAPERYRKNEIWKALRGELMETKRKRHITHVYLLTGKNLVKISRADIVKDIKAVLP